VANARGPLGAEGAARAKIIEKEKVK